ncbi:MAG: ATP-dependent helicase [Candidatus Thermoplasmatota archaeon]|jgi:Lhr-like helicase|nr:ATP-dependent helicase [Candidatus Thermoplasmatota archaeon]
MIRYSNTAYDTVKIVERFDEDVHNWFLSKFTSFTPPQRMSIPLIDKGENLLISSPTGSGKTLTAFLSIINRLYKLAKLKKLQNKTYCVYISPLKALARDIEKNLETPLTEIYKVARERVEREIRENSDEEDLDIEKLLPQEIRVGMRTGDTSAQAKQKMTHTAPHILITTPESLSIGLSTSKFVNKLKQTEYVIIDEIHDLAASKRGTLLSLSLERFQNMVAREFIRIGLSATQSPIEDIARFLVGRQDGKWRDVTIMEYKGSMKYDIKVIPAFDSLDQLYNDRLENAVEMIRTYIDKYDSTIVFTNTRNMTEKITHMLKEKGLSSIATHHGSLGKETRFRIEDQLKRGELKAVVTSSSLELGIDVGHIDLVIQLGSTKSTARGLQRIGRAGHALGLVTRGRFIALEIEELIECCTIARNINKSKMDDITIPRMCEDVLSQSIIGMSLEGDKSEDEVFDVVSGSAPFLGLTRESFNNILDFLSTEDLIKYRIYPKIIYSKDDKEIGTKQLSRMIYFLNVGTIPAQMEYKVRRAEDGSYLGTLSDSFVEKMTKNDVFLLGGRSYQFIKAIGSMVYVKHAGSITPTLPSWSGEFFSRTTDLSVDVGRFLSTLEASLLEKGFDRRLLKKLSISGKDVHTKKPGSFDKLYHKDIVKTLQDQYALSEKGCHLLLDQIFLQIVQGFVVPSGRKILVEGYIDNLRMKHIIIHSVFGKRVNEAIARALAPLLTNRYGGKIKYSISDNGIMLTLEEVKSFHLYDMFNILHSQNIEQALQEDLHESELFKRRFVHCANRGFIILKNYKGYEISVKKQQRTALDILSDVPPDILGKMPVYKEAHNEVMNQYMDLSGAKKVLNKIARGDIQLYVKDYSTRPSTFSHPLIVTSLTDVSSLATKLMVFKQLGGELFEEIIGYGSSTGVDGLPARFPRELLVEHFRRDASFYKNIKIFVKDAKDEYNAGLERISSGEIGDKTVPMSRVEIIKKVLLDFLHRFGPFTHRELEAHFSFALKNINLLMVLSELEREADVIKDSIIVDDTHDYYIARRDYRSLRLKNEGSVVLATDGFNNFAYRKFFEIHDEFNEILDKGDIIGSPLDIFQRSKRFTKSKWLSSIKDGVLVQVRFIRSKMYFLPMDRVSGFIWVRRTSRLNSVEQILLKYIMQNPGVKRSKIYKEVNLNKAQIYEALYRLEKNLWLGRTHIPSADMASAVGFVYIENKEFDDIFFPEEDEYENLDPSTMKEEIADHIKRSRNKLVSYLLSIYGPMTKSTLQEHSRLFGNELENVLSELFSEEKIKRVFVENPYPTEMLIITEDFTTVLEIKEGFTKKSVFTGIISDTHPYFHLIVHKAFLRFTGVWTHLLTEGNEPLAALRLERKKDSIRILNLEMVSSAPERNFSSLGSWTAPLPDDNSSSRHVLSLLVKELDNLLDFYSNFDIDVIKIENISEISVEQLIKDSSWIIKSFLREGLVVMNDYLVMGNMVEKTYPMDKILKYVFYKQHIHPDNVFEDPRDLIKTFGTVCSTEEIRLRTQDDDVTLSAYAKYNDLVKGILIPARQMFTTPENMEKFKVALKKRISPTAKYLLDVIPTGFVVSDKKWFERTSLGRTVYLEKKKELIDALYVVKDAKNTYVKVGDATNLSKKRARRQCIRNVFENFGVFTLPRLRQYVGAEFSLEELRGTVNKLTRKGFLVKGYLQEGSKDIHYILKSDLELLDEINMYRKFILPPKDPLWYYLQDDIHRKFGKGDWYVLFKGGEMVAGFVGKEKDEKFKVKKYGGEDRYKFMVERWIWRRGLDVEGI